MKFIILASVSHSAVEASTFQLRCKGLDHGRDFLMHLNISLYYMCTHVYTQRSPGDEGRESDIRCIALRFPLTCTIDMHVPA